MKEEYFVYVLKSAHDGKYYTGFTTNLSKRLAEHNSGSVASTKRRIPFEIVYYEFCLCIEDALHREKYLKTSYGKRYIKNRIRKYLSTL